MHQDSFRSVVCRSLSKSLPSRSKDGSCPETFQCVVPCVVTLQPSVGQGCCQGREQSSWSQSYREERSMSLQRDYLMTPSLSKHFAEDLLRGAMDLQESLAMLERFQAASQSMRQSNAKKRRPESPDIDTIIREVLLRPSSNAKMVLPRTVSNTSHGQSGNSTDELKNLVKDSLHRKKNLLSSVSYNDEQQHSLSQSNTTQQKKVVQTDKPTPSLVAKLMGLDGLPSQNDRPIMKDDKIKPVSSPRALFDMEMPKSKRLLPQLSAEEDSRLHTEKHVSEKLLPEHYNARKNHNLSQKTIGPSYDTPVINEIGSMKRIHREKNMEQVRAKSPKEIKVVSPASRNQQQMKQPTEISRRTREKQKSHLTERNREGRKDMKPKESSASHTKILQKPDKKLVSSSSSGSMKPILRKASSNSRQKAAARRDVKSSTVDEIVACQVQREIAHILDESDGPSTEHSATPSDESVRSADWDAESSVNDIRNDLISEFNESVISTAASHGESMDSADADLRRSSAVIFPTKEAEIKDEIVLLLLSDQSFLSRAAAAMTGIGSYAHLSNNRYRGTTKPEMKNHRELYLDTAVEQLEREHGRRNSLCYYYTGFQGERRRAARAYLSLEALLTDIGNGIRKLNSYAATTDGCGTTDSSSSLQMKLERDLRCTDAWINGVWDMGWEDWIFMEETECFVRDAGEEILSLLMEEVALDLSDILPPFLE